MILFDQFAWRTSSLPFIGFGLRSVAKQPDLLNNRNVRATIRLPDSP
jgi:hypothetical protein